MKEKKKVESSRRRITRLKPLFIQKLMTTGPLIEYLLRHYFGKEARPIGRQGTTSPYCACPQDHTGRKFQLEDR